MNLRYAITAIWVLVIPLLGIAAAGPQLFMPGKVAAGHAALEKNCESCHAPWNGAPEQRCVECHAKEKPIINPQTHGAECKSCHLEHKGRNMSIAKFDHTKANYEMSAEHSKLACTDCHVKGYTNFTAQNCAECHAKEPKKFNLSEHFDLFGASCLDCHRKTGTEAKSFDHSRFGYNLSAKYSMLTCKQCHSAGLKSFNHSITDYALDAAHSKLACTDCHATKYSFSARTCEDCHLKPEVAKGFDMKRHENIFGSSCLDCHSKAGFDLRSFNHALTGYAIGKDHYRLNCKDCHPQKFTAYTCNGACHGQTKLLREHWEHGIRDYENCLECHRSKEAERQFKREREKFKREGRD